MFNVMKEIWRDHKGNFSQIFKMAKADLIKTYRGAALGWSWALLRPALTLFTYWFAFNFGLRSGGDVNGYPFFLWLALGITPWFYMSDMLHGGTESIRKYKYLVNKMKFPVSVIPTFVSVSKLMVNLILMLLVLVIFWCSGYAPTIYYLQLPFYLLCSFAFWTLWAQLASLLAAVSKDFLNLVKSFVTPLFWLSGILWNADTLQAKSGWLSWVLKCNPVTFIISGFRDCLIYERWFFEGIDKVLIFIGWLLIMWLLSVWAYQRLRKEIPDVL